MCGIAGYWDWNHQKTTEELQTAINGMTQFLRDRGPDSGGIWIDRAEGMALGHRRLAIRDLSRQGYQPMISPDGRFVLSYNGEIYNTVEIWDSLAKEGIRPQGSSDSEALLLSIMAFGLKQTLENSIGMFAFALWDRQQQKLVLARDRFGVKPLYWTEDSKRMLFASVPDAFYFADGWNPEINMNALGLYLRFGYIPAPFSIWQNVYKLPQGHYLVIDAARRKLESYWDSLAVAQAGLENPLNCSEAEATDLLDDLLTDSVFRRMASDVPLGAFLSGGIDSSVVAALMQKCSSAPIRTFSVGFEEKDYNEAPYAAAMATHLRTEHTEIYVPSAAAWEMIPQLPEIYDEPFGDASAIPTTLVCRLIRQYVTTALSGDGGDELFAGYGRYADCLSVAPANFHSSRTKHFIANILKKIPARTWDDFAALLPERLRPANAGARIGNLMDLNWQGTFANFYQRYSMNLWWHPDTLLVRGRTPSTILDSAKICNAFTERLALMQFFDTTLYLSDDILVKLDRASMSCSLEARVPLLDHRVYQFAWRIPTAWRQKDGKGKYLLRKVLERYVPKNLFDRPKMGFGIPIEQWLKGPLRGWAESLLAPAHLKKAGLVRIQPVRRAWERLLSGVKFYDYPLWAVLMLLAWLERKRPQARMASELQCLIV